MILLMLISYTVAQVDTAWVRRFNGLGNGADTAWAIAVDDSGNVLVTGSTVGSGTGNDWTTIKYNPNGDTVWVRQYASPGIYNERPSSIAIGNSGDIYITGFTMSSNFGDYLTIKYSPAGETLWTKRLDGPENGFDFATAITIDGAENIYVAGYTEGQAVLDYDYLTVKYDPSGNQQWARVYNSALNRRDEAKAIGVDWLGNVYVTGSSNTLGSANYDYTTIKYSPPGDFRWAMNYNGPADSTDMVNALVLDDSGNIFVTGSSIGTGTSTDFATIKYTPLAETVWIRRYNSPANDSDEGSAIAVDNWGNVYVTGSSKGSVTGYDYTTIKYSPLGETLWTRTYNGPANNNDIANGIKVDAQGNVYATGYSESTGTGYDYATVKYNSSGSQQWVARYNGPVNSTDQTEAIAVDGYGNVYVTGYSEGINPDWATIKYVQPGYLSRDVGAVTIASPSYVVKPDTVVTPACSLYNYGDTTETYLVRMKIGSFYEDTIRVIGHLPGTYRYLTFSPWTANQLGMHTVTCSTELLVDGFKRNDKQTSSVVVGTVDAEVFRILFPTGIIDTLPVVPIASIRNNSSVPLDIPVTFKIFKDTLVYFDSRIVNILNGRMSDVSFDIFPISGPDTGDYTTEVSVSLFGDQDTSNNTKTGAFSVKIATGFPDIWEALQPIPSGLSLKKPKAGSCITELRDKLYFLKASNTQDFHVFTPNSYLGTWTSDTMPLGSKENGDGKKPKKGAAITAYQQGHAVYVLRGNNSVGFWKYQADTIGSQTIGWTKLRNIPEGAKKPKEGTGMATFRKHGDGYIFTMKGSKTDEFYIYDIAGDNWIKVSSPSLGHSGKFGYKQGSCLTYDGDEFVYVLKGNYGDFFKYSIDSDSWHQLRQYDYKIFLNREGKKKKVKEGSGIVYYNENLYLLKGGNTTEFWRYEIASDTWIQMNTATTWIIPLGGGKKVKGGGCLTMDGSYFYVVKGANTDEFYRHTLPTLTLASAQSTINGTQAENKLINRFNLTIAPNPANKIVRIKYNLPMAGKVNIKLYNVTGALVKSYTNTNPVKDGVLVIDTKSLASGVYILDFNSGKINTNRKIVLRK
jgi:uncharacterized delta-60 repeat protein